jgi:hypothetical protein
MSERNLKKAYEYQEPVIRKRRLEFYRSVREMKEEWLKNRESK